MPELHEYYRFLTRMYLKECYVAEPPEGGWPEVNAETIGVLGKTDERCLGLGCRQLSGGGIGVLTEYDLPRYKYPYIFSLTEGGYYNLAFLLDTKLGIVIPDFFELLRDLFRQLFYVPISLRRVYFAATERLGLLADIYRAYGWPDLERYNKRDCMKVVQDWMEEHSPNYADYREKNE
ncbi:uncharacterized protein B0T15DRAFT_560730 [Chaetomium strumarium]|uniref:Uncharacterized protein n=1 Tax=Chaetomium strumarium TaxID=1170767 RepID=A0AAJ0GPB5_9PEZI|nr:hypothetical protein B0T15DRAFT_560730 [Chaetomium strumarium]